MEITVNGRSHRLAGSLSLTQLLDQLELKPDRCAMELNRQLVPRVDWDKTILQDNDELEIVHFVGGG